VALRGWYPIEILHFPVRSYEHCLRKYVTQFVALERNAEKGIPGHMADAYRAYRAGRLGDFYGPLVVDDVALDRGLERGDLVLDTRLRDRLRALGYGNPDVDARSESATWTVDAAAAYAAEYSVLLDADVGNAVSDRVDRLDRRLASAAVTVGGRLRTRLARSRG
jgi:hypothetical protein